MEHGAYEYSLNGNCGRQSRRKLASRSTLHQLNGLFELQFVVEGNELWLLRALPCYQPFLHILPIEAVHSAMKTERQM